mmetsp:Transcript_8046/g.20034  ORF Transcript_8046/g.20034 Transcript_8046/m.20034 type:complete len:88 (+) Transcript_8046:497-760(+)
MEDEKTKYNIKQISKLSDRQESVAMSSSELHKQVDDNIQNDIFENDFTHTRCIIFVKVRAIFWKDNYSTGSGEVKYKASGRTSERKQ